jgi:hypothetical protein
MIEEIVMDPSKIKMVRRVLLPANRVVFLFLGMG